MYTYSVFLTELSIVCFVAVYSACTFVLWYSSLKFTSSNVNMFVIFFTSIDIPLNLAVLMMLLLARYNTQINSISNCTGKSLTPGKLPTAP